MTEENMELLSTHNNDVSETGCVAFGKMNSCLGPPSSFTLAAALAENDLQMFTEILVDIDSIELNEELSQYGHSTLLHLVVASGKAHFLKELIKRREVNPNKPHRVQRRFPIHVAAENGRADLMELLLTCGAELNARSEDGSTALHILAARSAVKWLANDPEQKGQLQESFLQCLRLLLRQTALNIDIENNIGVTPMYFAVIKGSKEAVKLLLDAGACITTEVDGEVVEDLLTDKFPEMLIGNLDKNRRNKDEVENKLFHELYFESYEPGKFQEAWMEVEKRGVRIQVDYDNGQYTFLQFCCDQGHEKLVAFMLEQGADPNHCAKNNNFPPITLAAYHGYYKVIQVFKEWGLRGNRVDFCAVDGIKYENALHKILKEESKSHINIKYRNYERCLNILLEDRPPTLSRLMQPAINAQDQLGHSPLHIAAQMGNHSAVRKLLRREANIGLKNHRNETPINHIPPAVMEEFLDDCLEGEGLASDERFQITFKYSFLGPPLYEQTAADSSDEKTKEDYETKSESGLRAATDDLPESEPLWYMSQLPDHRYLLKHPVIKSFLCLKWRRIRPYFYLNLVCYLLLVGFLTVFLIQLNLDLDESEDDTTKTYGERLSTATNFLRCITAALLVILSIRELFQALVSFRRYIFRPENWLEITMIALSYSLIFGTNEMGLNLTLVRSISATVILLSWAEMVMLLGRHPKLSTFITMFSTVSYNFMLFLTWYISIILAFGLAFFIILHRPSKTQSKIAENVQKIDEGEEINAYFVSPEKTLLKTIVMSLTGEIEFEGIDFGGEYGKLVFLLYVFFVMLVLVNLLNGLAVSDITEIKQEAEVVSLVSRVELVAFIESMLLGDPFHFLTNWPPFSWSKYIPACACINSLYRKLCFKRCMNCLIGTTLLFSNRLTSKRAVFYPNQSLKERSLPGTSTESQEEHKRKGYDRLIMDEDILLSAKTLVVGRLEKDRMEEVALKLRHNSSNYLWLIFGLLNDCFESLSSARRG